MEVMMNHLRRGFRPWPLNDIYHVEEALKEYDEHLYLLYNPQTNEHLIMDGFIDMAVMKIPQVGFPFLTSCVVDHMKKIHVLNGFDANQEIQKHEEEREREREKKLNDMAEDFAKESHEAYKNAYEYGRFDGAQKYVQGIEVSS
jgi:flagellar biosynthesis/type III secretory pathway protein FliH